MAHRVRNVKMLNRAKFRGNRSKRDRDIAIFKFQDSSRPPSWIFKIWNIHSRMAQEGRTAPPSQIWSKSVKLRPKHGDFSTFQHGGRRHLGFLNLEFLTVGLLKRAELHGRAKFGQNRSKYGWDMAIFRFFKMAAAAILDFSNFKFLRVKWLKRAELRPVPNLVEIGQNATEIWRFSIFQNGGRRHLGFFKFQFLTVGLLKMAELRRRAKLGRNRSKCGRDMAIFRFFKMVTIHQIASAMCVFGPHT